VPTKDRAERLHGQENGRRYAKTVTKSKRRRRERDAGHDLARRLRAGIKDWEDDDE
jgi:hypothetical protein